MRLINADDLIIKLRDWYTQELHSVHISTSGREPSGEDLEECFIEGVLIAIKDLVDQMPTIITTDWRWIPCEEKQPDEADWYVVTLDDGSHATRWYSFHGWERLAGQDVIAWLPNPEPYKVFKQIVDLFDRGQKDD